MIKTTHILNFEINIFFTLAVNLFSEFDWVQY